MIDELPPIETKPYRPDEDRERVRSILAFVVIGALMLLVLSLTLFSLFFAPEAERGKIAVETVFPALLALGGAVTGFYYGTKSKE